MSIQSLPAETDHLNGVKTHVIIISMCVTTLLYLVISQGVDRTHFCPRTPLTHSLLDILPKIAFEASRGVFWSFSGYMSQNVVYSTSQSYAPDAKYHLPKFGRQKVTFQSCSLDVYFSLSLHSRVAGYLLGLILVG